MFILKGSTFIVVLNLVTKKERTFLLHKSFGENKRRLWLVQKRKKDVNQSIAEWTSNQMNYNKRWNN